MLELFAPILGLIFPKHCFGCGKFGSYLCMACNQARVHYVKRHKCHICKKKVVKDDLVHNYCKNKSYLAGVIVVANYSDLMKKLVRELKYNYITQLASDLRNLIRASPAWDILDNLAVEVVFPVPLHKKRRKERGFNQAELLVSLLGYKQGLGLKRIAYTNSQAKLNKRKRLSNLKNAFAYTGESLLGKRVLVVDDVMTTGATLEHCAQTLLAAGAKEIYGLVLARG